MNSKTSSWLASEGTIGFGSFQFAQNSSTLAHDYGYPIYDMSTGTGAEAVKIDCTATWGCPRIQGTKVYVDPRELPEDGGAKGEDSHFALIDIPHNKEYDFWATQWPPVNGVLKIGSGGWCTLNGNGTDGCTSTASSTPLSLGLVRAKDLLKAIQSSTGSLPYALAVAVKCSYGFVAPATASDGKCSAGPPQGARVYLAMHDSDVNATSNVPLAKAILRTMDEDHYGMIITDTDGGQDGFALTLESDLTYTAFGLAGPFKTLFVEEATAEGLATTPYNSIYTINLKYTGIDFSSKLKFL